MLYSNERKEISRFSWLDDTTNSKIMHRFNDSRVSLPYNKKIKLLFIINVNIANGGGMERVLLRYIQEIPQEEKEKYSITVIQTGNMDRRRIDERDIRDIFIKSNAELVTLQRLNSNSFRFKNALLATILNIITEGFRNRKERHIVREISASFDVVYLFRNSFVKFINKGPKIIGSFHERNLNPSSYRFPGSLLMKFVAFLIHRGLIWRKINLYHYIARNWLPFMPVNAIFIPNGVQLDTSTIFHTRKEGEKIRILFVGRLVEEKGIRVLLEAFSLLDDCENYELNIVGTGELEKLLTSMHKTGIIYHGRVSDDELKEIYEKCDLFVLPSHADIFSLAVLEALAHGEYVIADNFLSGAFDEFMNIGMLEYVDTDPEKIKEKIEEFRHKNLEYARVKTRKLIDEKYSWNVVCRDLYSIFERLA